MAVPPLRTQNVIRTIVRDIVQACKSAGHIVSEELAALMVKTVLIHPSNNFDPTVAQTKDEVDRIIQLSVQKLTEPTTSLDTLKMQLFFDLNYATRDMFIEEHEHMLDSRVHSQLEHLVNCRPRTRDELQAMYADFVNLLIVWSDLGTPNEVITVKETTAALRSVFPQPELGSFLGLDKKDKERQLTELTEIVAGIRLFNKDCGKGGRTIDNIPEKLPGATAAVIVLLDERMFTATQHTTMCLAIVEQLDDDLLEESEWEVVWSACTNGRQEMVFLTTIKKDLQCIQEEVLVLHKKLKAQLAELHGTVQARVAIPTVQVYPLFIQLSQLWKRLRQQMVITSLLHSIMLGFDSYTEQRHKLMKGELIDKCKTHIVVKSDQTRAKEAEQKMDLAPGTYQKVEVRQPEHVQNFERVALVYQGFCPWALVKRSLLIPGCRRKAAALYKGRYYTFSSMEAMLQFAINPDWYHDNVLLMAKKFPELIHLLQLHTQVYPPTDKSKDLDRICPSDFVETSTAGIQTETHPIKENIVPTYVWNEWDMRRRAILLANLQTRLTHSTQTKESHLRRENATQVFLPRTMGTQTLKETGVNCVNDHHYLSGLQGYRKGKPSRFKYIDFTQLDL